MRRLLLAVTARRFTALGMGGAFLLGSTGVLFPAVPWWAEPLIAIGAAALIVLAVEGLRWLAYRWLRNHQEAGTP